MIVPSAWMVEFEGLREATYRRFYLLDKIVLEILKLKVVLDFFVNFRKCVLFVAIFENV